MNTIVEAHELINFIIKSNILIDYFTILKLCGNSKNPEISCVPFPEF